ncbi:transcriptional regulator [Duganella sp. FT92W]|uniref:Transcriptional regulator n=1 Tax=Pseudoduganella rivuli TaxID=2666085 RepID=A0A7X2LUZ4_9BURK|nr:transcriptional regulator [Pseudoduganella rivuli]MRV76185.1 transcriptional regulator [Pseudoduganella rivuli]
MKPHFVVLAALAASSLLALAQPNTNLPAPWITSGDAPGQYESGRDADGSLSGSPGAIYFRHARGSGDSWGSLMQQFSAEAYKGKRVRFEADVMTRDVSGWSGLWMRVDSSGGYGSAFYNSQDKPIKGTTGWQHRSVVLDVGEGGKAISIGLIGGGTGETWLRNVKFDVVGNDVPVDRLPEADMPKAPVL